MSDDQSLNTVEECARSFMSRYEHEETLHHVIVPGLLGTLRKRIPAFRLPLKPDDCCDLCEQLGKLAVMAIGPDLRFGMVQVRLFPSRHHLVLKVHLPGDSYESPTYFTNRCFYIYSHPGMFSSRWLGYTTNALPLLKNFYAHGISLTHTRSKSSNGLLVNCKSVQRSMVAMKKSQRLCQQE
jgi:hypothetical protein